MDVRAMEAAQIL